MERGRIKAKQISQAPVLDLNLLFSANFSFLIPLFKQKSVLPTH